MCKNNRFALKTTAIVLLGFVFCLALAGRSDARDMLDSQKENAERTSKDMRWNNELREGLTPDEYANELSVMFLALSQVAENISDVHDAELRLTPEEKERRRAHALKMVDPIKARIKKLIDLSNESGGKPSGGWLRAALDNLCHTLNQLDAQDELFALERDIREWLNESDVREIRTVLEEYALFLETERKAVEQAGDDGDRVDVLFALRDEEKTKDKPNEALINRLNDRIALEVERKAAKLKSEAETVFQDAIDRENAVDQPNEELLDKLRDKLEDLQWRRFIDADDFDGAAEHTRRSIDQTVEQPTTGNMRRTNVNLRKLTHIDLIKADELFTETIDRYLASGNETLAKEASQIGSLRELVGVKIKLEGVCVDGKPFDWNEYLGKPGVVVLFSSNDVFSEDFMKLCDVLRRYADCDGVGIIGYVADDDPALRNHLAKETPWKTVSQSLTLEAKDRKYRDLGVYYGFSSEPSATADESFYRSLPRAIMFDERGISVQIPDARLFTVESFLHEKQPEVFEREYARLSELLDVPDGQNAAFYVERRATIFGEADADLRRLDDGNPIFGDRFKTLRNKQVEAINAIYKKLAFTRNDDDSVDNSKKMVFLQEYVLRVMPQNARAAIEELMDFERAQSTPDQNRLDYLQNVLNELAIREAEADKNNAEEKLQKLIDEENAKETPNNNTIGLLTLKLLEAKVDKAIATNDESALQEALDLCVAKSGEKDEYGNLKAFNRYVDALLRVLNERHKRPLAAEYLRLKAIKQFESSDILQAREYAFALAAVDRRNALPGNEIVFKGSYLNPDDPENSNKFDWNSYRGKPVLIFYYNLISPQNCEGLDDVLAAYEKYHGAGLEVLGYYHGLPGAYEKEFLKLLKEKNLPWQTVWPKRSPDEPKQKNVSIANMSPRQAALLHFSLDAYYGLACPSAILVGADGKVIDLEAFGSRLYDDLEKLFPDVP